MSYVNLTHTFTSKIPSFIESEWACNNEANCFNRQFTARVGYFLSAPLELISSIVDTAIGLLATVESLLALGTEKSCNKIAQNHLISASAIISSPYKFLLRTLNPTATFDECAPVSSKGNGLVSHYVINFLKEYGRSCTNSPNLFKQHVISRVTYALLAISCLVTRTADGAIGIIAAAFSFITLGKIDTINNIALRGLRFPGIIDDLVFCTVKFINPWSKGWNEPVEQELIQSSLVEDEIDDIETDL